MSQVKKEIVDVLEKIKYEKDHKQKYDVILDFVRNQKIALTRNKRGYWFDLTSVPDSVAVALHNVVMLQYQRSTSISEMNATGQV